MSVVYDQEKTNIVYGVLINIAEMIDSVFPIIEEYADETEKTDDVNGVLEMGYAMYMLNQFAVMGLNNLLPDITEEQKTKGKLIIEYVSKSISEIGEFVLSIEEGTFVSPEDIFNAILDSNNRNN